MAEANGTKILPVWVPRELNTVADALSKAADIDDDELTHHAFVAVCGLFGLKPAIDLFASHVSTKCESFASRSYSPHAIVFDAFSAAWAPFGPLYIFPPVALIARVLNRLTQEQDGVAVIILPVWPSQPWWPSLCPDGVHTRVEVRNAMRLSRSSFASANATRSRFLSRLGGGFRVAAFLWDSRAGAATTRPFCLHRFLGRPCPSDCVVARRGSGPP